MICNIQNEQYIAVPRHLGLGDPLWPDWYGTPEYPTFSRHFTKLDLGSN